MSFIALCVNAIVKTTACITRDKFSRLWYSRSYVAKICISLFIFSIALLWCMPCIFWPIFVPLYIIICYYAVTSIIEPNRVVTRFDKLRYSLTRTFNSLISTMLGVHATLDENVCERIEDLFSKISTIKCVRLIKLDRTAFNTIRSFFDLVKVSKVAVTKKLLKEINSDPEFR